MLEIVKGFDSRVRTISSPFPLNNDVVFSVKVALGLNSIYLTCENLNHCCSDYCCTYS